MTVKLAKSATFAMVWQAAQVGGVKLIFLARTLILARLLVPDDFGLLVIAMIPIDFLLSVSDFGLIPALVQRQKVEEKHFAAAWTIGFFRAMFIGLIIFLGAPFIAGIFAEPRAIILIQVLAIRPVIESMSSIKIAELTRSLRFRSLTILKIAEAITNTIIAVVLAPQLGVWALVIGHLAGSVTYVLVSYFVAPYRPRFFRDKEISRSLLQFGKWIFLTSLIGVLGGVVLQAVISRRLGATELGLYFLAAKLAFLSADIATEVVGNVTFPLYARLQASKQQAARAFRAILSGMFAMLLPLCGLLMVLAPSLVQNILGPNWVGTESIIRVLILVTIIGLLGEVTVPILKGVGQPGKLALLKAVQLSLILSFVWPLAGRFGVAGAAAAWLPAIGVTQLFSIYFVQKALPQPFAGLSKPMIAILITTVIGAFVAFQVDSLIPGLAGFILACSISGIIMIGLYWILERRFNLGFAENIVLVFPQLSTLFRNTKLSVEIKPGPEQSP
jgi:lipopolysaccharide exporter